MAKRFEEYRIIEDGKYYVVKTDVNTGDVISKTPAVKHKDTSDYFKKGEFLTVHIRFSKMFMLKKDYGNLTFRVLFALIDRIEFNNRIRTFRQAELARIIDSHQPDVSKSLKVLENDKVIKKINHDYYFSPKFVRYISDNGFEHLQEEGEVVDE